MRNRPKDRLGSASLIVAIYRYRTCGRTNQPSPNQKPRLTPEVRHFFRLLR